MNIHDFIIKQWKLSLFAALVLIALTSSMFINNKNTSTNEFIVQGASQATMIEQVEAVGGKVIHSFKVISAISAALTPSQKKDITSANPMLRLFANTDVDVGSRTDGWDVSKSLKFQLNKNKIKWRVKNNSKNDYLVERIVLSWPEANGVLKKLKIAGKELNGNYDASSVSIDLDEQKLISAKHNRMIKFEMEFDNISSVVDSDYEIQMILTDGSQVAMESNVKNEGSSPIRYKLDNNELSWKTLNNTNKELFVSKVIIDWPTMNGQVEKFEINNEKIFSSAVSGGSVQLDLEQYISIKENDDINVKMSFTQLSSVADNDYSVLLMFTDGTSKALTTTNATPEQGKNRNTFFPTIVRANEAHQQGITGRGVTVAVIDTGIKGYKNLRENTDGDSRLFHTYNVLDNDKPHKVRDNNGHGTHIASIIASNSTTYTLSGDKTDSYNSIAPDADLVIVKAFDENGRASYAQILAAVEYVVDNHEALNIKVLNLSFSAIPSSYYWDDPINQAIMVAWEAGITVVAAAGNQGPDAMTIGVPGNTPYVITVGAMSDNYTPGKTHDDFVTTFSSAGPTFEGFLKPEIVAPGGHIQGLMGSKTYIGKNYSMYDDNKHYFLLSGSSQSTAITSGIVALMLQKDPSLSPDDIKCRLMHSAKIATKSDGALAFSIFQQGAGLVDAMSALEETMVGCGNTGMDIVKDITGDDHFVGPARRHENNGDFYILDTEGLEWNGLYNDAQLWGNIRFQSNAQLWGNIRFESEAQLWGNVRFNSDAQLWGNIRFWSDAQLWGNVRFNSNAQLWGNVRFNSDAQLWGNIRSNSESNIDTSSIINKWVDHE